MRSGAGERNGEGLVDLVSEVARHARRTVRLETEIAVTELAARARHARTGIALVTAAAVVVLLASGVAVAATAAIVALVLPWWAALVLVTAALLALGAALAILGIGRIRASRPWPEAAVEEARRTADALAGVR